MASTFWEPAMSLHPEPIGPVPDETARVAGAAFPKGNTYMHMRDALSALYTAGAMNSVRLDDWPDRIPLAQTRCSRFGALAHLN